MKKRTTRKHYQLLNPIDLAIDGARISEAKHLDKLRLMELSAIDSFAKGNAQPADWRILADMHNVAETLAKSGVGAEVLKVCSKAQEALESAHAAQVSRGKLGMTGPQLEAMRDLFGWHDAQRTAIGRSDYEKSIKKTGDLIRGRSKNVRVMV